MADPVPTPPPVLGPALERELDRIAREEGRHVAVEASRTGASVEAEATLPKGWAIVATARYYWNQTWDAAVRAVKRW